MYQQLMHITNEQLQFIVEKVDERLESECKEIDESQFGIEIIGHGLDANLMFTAYPTIIENVVTTDRGEMRYNDVNYTLNYAQLVTYIDGEEVPNDTTCKQLAKYINKYIN